VQQQVHCVAIVSSCGIFLVAAAAVFKATGGQVPRQETKTYIGAGLAVLGVNLVRLSTPTCRLHHSTWYAHTRVSERYVAMLTTLREALFTAGDNKQPSRITGRGRQH
jgi:hypothetical protein